MTERIQGTRQEVRKFGLLFAAVFTLLGLYMLWRGNADWYWAPILGGGFLLAGFVAYPVLRPVYLGWMKFAFVLGWINTRLLLGLFFFLVMTPIGVGMRLFGKDLLDETIEKERESYWTKREKGEVDRERYERLF